MPVATSEIRFRSALAAARSPLLLAAGFSVIVNILGLTGAIFMLSVYDRALPSGSVETLTALTVLAAGLFFALGALDHLRGRLMMRAGARIEAALDGATFSPEALAAGDGGDRDIDALRRFLSSPAALALMDTPWAPLNFLMLWLLHPWLALLGLVAAIVMAVLAALSHLSGRTFERAAREASALAERRLREAQSGAELARAMGAIGALGARWRQAREDALALTVRHADRSGFYQTFARTFRLAVQSGALALGALLVLRGELGASSMIAGSILLGRALAPMDHVMGGCSVVAQAWRALRRLRQRFAAQAQTESGRLISAPPHGALSAHDVLVAAPGAGRTPLLRGVSFSLEPGEIVGVIGPGGAGKTSLLKTAIGLRAPLFGELRLGGAPIGQWAPDAFGAAIGYVPQEPALFAGTVAENIARFDPDARPEAVVMAAKRAGAHGMISDWPQGYDTQLGDGGWVLSSGQRQRVALARAMYGNPRILALDEPNANLDAAGDHALMRSLEAARDSGLAVLLATHRPGLLAICDRLIALGEGRVRAIGRTEEVLRATTVNHDQLSELRQTRGARAS